MAWSCRHALSLFLSVPAWHCLAMHLVISLLLRDLWLGLWCSAAWSVQIAHHIAAMASLSPKNLPSYSSLSNSFTDRCRVSGCVRVNVRMDICGGWPQNRLGHWSCSGTWTCKNTHSVEDLLEKCARKHVFLHPSWPPIVSDKCSIELKDELIKACKAIRPGRAIKNDVQRVTQKRLCQEYDLNNFLHEFVQPFPWLAIRIWPLQFQKSGFWLKWSNRNRVALACGFECALACFGKVTNETLRRPSRKASSSPITLGGSLMQAYKGRRAGALSLCQVHSRAVDKSS